MGNIPNIQSPSLNEYSITTQQQAAIVRELNYLVSKPTWHVTFKEYTDNRWKRILPLIKRTDITSIKLEDIKSPDLFASFIHIDFYCLTRLQLKFVYIYSLQTLAKLNVPQLVSLEFNANRVFSLRPLRKLRAPQLKQLDIYENMTAQGVWLPECNFNIEMERIVVFSSHHMIVPECYNWLFKMNMNRLDTFEYYSRRVIDNSPVKSMLKQRFPSIKLFFRYDRFE